MYETQNLIANQIVFYRNLHSISLKNMANKFRCKDICGQSDDPYVCDKGTLMFKEMDLHVLALHGHQPNHYQYAAYICLKAI